MKVLTPSPGSYFLPAYCFNLSYRGLLCQLCFEMYTVPL